MLKGLLSHLEATEQIKADAAKSPERLQLHKGFVLHIKHFSQSYRPEAATVALRNLFSDLVDMEFGTPYKPATANLPFEGNPRLSIQRDVAYGDDVSKLQRMDAYLVKAKRPSPVVIEIHGGGWRRGAKSQFEAYAGGLITQVLESGISVISIGYRLTPYDQWPAPVEDVTRAVQFIRAQAKTWNIDPQRIAALGGSAGAHLSAWIALHDDLADAKNTDAIARQSTRLNCFVDMWGPMDLTRVKPAELNRTGLRGADFADAFGALFAVTVEAYNMTPYTQGPIREASPIFLVTADDPPALIVHPAPAELAGNDHPPIPETINDPHSAWFGVLLADRMEEAGIEVVRYIGPEVGKNPADDDQVTLSFLRQCLKVK